MTPQQNQYLSQDEQERNCLFCQIINGSIASDITYQNDNLIVLNDINPQAPIHQLIIPKKHIATVNQLTEKENSLIGELFNTAKKCASHYKIEKTGYRLIMNCEQGAGQTIFHIHLHLLGGRTMSWP